MKSQKNTKEKLNICENHLFVLVELFLFLIIPGPILFL
jgi:hypothetical protein